MSDATQPPSLPAFPERKDGIEAIPVHEDLVLYDGTAKNGISLNQTARKVWELCDGTRTVGGMVEEIGRGLDVSDKAVLAELEKDLRSTLAEFKRNALLK